MMQVLPKKERKKKPPALTGNYHPIRLVQLFSSCIGQTEHGVNKLDYTFRHSVDFVVTAQCMGALPCES